jgi:hypothetical protein
MASIIVTQPEHFPARAQTEFLQHLYLLVLSQATPRAIDLRSGVECMGAKTLIGFSDIFVALLTDAGHLVNLLSKEPFTPAIVSQGQVPGSKVLPPGGGKFGGGRDMAKDHSSRGRQRAIRGFPAPATSTTMAL